MSEILEKFKEFLSDSESDEMFITGYAGTGKTTSLAQLVEYCIEQRKTYVASAFTHKAVAVLESKLPENAILATLHSVLKKIPITNTNAVKEAQINLNKQIGRPEFLEILFVDEYSMIGKRDYEHIKHLCCKVVYLGDVHQLPPINDKFVIYPKSDKYNIVLTEIKRQDKDNKLVETIKAVSESIKYNREPDLKNDENLIHSDSLVFDFVKEKIDDKVILCFTNKQVQFYNFHIQGRDEPEIGDDIFCNTLHEYFKILDIKPPTEKLDSCYNNNDEVIINPKMKYEEGCYMLLQDYTGLKWWRFCVFGTYNYKLKLQSMARPAMEANLKLQKKTKLYDVESYSRIHNNDMTFRRNLLWEEYHEFTKNVCCVDFKHAITIHKSQGSTFEKVFVDVKDIHKSRDRKLRNKLKYVALSRTSGDVVVNV